MIQACCGGQLRIEIASDNRAGSERVRVVDSQRRGSASRTDLIDTEDTGKSIRIIDLQTGSGQSRCETATAELIRIYFAQYIVQVVGIGQVDFDFIGSVAQNDGPGRNARTAVELGQRSIGRHGRIEIHHTGDFLAPHPERFLGRHVGSSRDGVVGDRQQSALIPSETDRVADQFDRRPGIGPSAENELVANAGVSQFRQFTDGRLDLADERLPLVFRIGCSRGFHRHPPHFVDNTLRLSQRRFGGREQHIGALHIVLQLGGELELPLSRQGLDSRHRIVAQPIHATTGAQLLLQFQDRALVVVDLKQQSRDP